MYWSSDSIGGALPFRTHREHHRGDHHHSQKKGSSPNTKRKAGTRAGLTKAAIAAAAAKLIESVGASEFSLRKLAKALDVGPTTIHAHFKGGAGAILGAVAALALAGATRPFKPQEEPAGYLRELLLKILEALHARPVVAKLVVLQLSSNPILDPLCSWRWPRSMCQRRPVQQCFSGRWASYWK